MAHDGQEPVFRGDMAAAVYGQPAEAKLNMPKVDKARLDAQRKAANKVGLDVAPVDPARAKKQAEAALGPKPEAPKGPAVGVEADEEAVAEGRVAEKAAREQAQEQAARAAGLEPATRRRREATIKAEDDEKIVDVKRRIEILAGGAFENDAHVKKMTELYRRVKNKEPLTSEDKPLLDEVLAAVTAYVDGMKAHKTGQGKGEINPTLFEMGKAIMTAPEAELPKLKAVEGSDRVTPVRLRRARPSVEGAEAQSVG